jgi:hypothetical protein
MPTMAASTNSPDLSATTSDDVLDLLFCLEQNRMLLERRDLEIRLKSTEVVLAELVE